jgi:hypothetical protein
MRCVIAVILSILSTMQYSRGQNLASYLKNDRLKTLSYPDSPIIGDEHHRYIAGFWKSESTVPDKQLVFPQQVTITCDNYKTLPKECVEISVTINAAKGMVSIGDLDTETYVINTWDSHGLVASYGGDLDSGLCQRHVLTVNFASGSVSVADIPTREKGCEAYTETNSYRLVRGNYYVDTTPGNDMDKPKE